MPSRECGCISERIALQSASREQRWRRDHRTKRPGEKMIAFQFRLPTAFKWRLIVTLFTGLALLCASRPSFAEVADWDKVVTAAKAEGGVVLYTALLGVPSTK